MKNEHLPFFSFAKSGDHQEVAGGVIKVQRTGGRNSRNLTEIIKMAMEKLIRP